VRIATDEDRIVVISEELSATIAAVKNGGGCPLHYLEGRLRIHPVGGLSCGYHKCGATEGCVAQTWLALLDNSYDGTTVGEVLDQVPADMRENTANQILVLVEHGWSHRDENDECRVLVLDIPQDAA